MLVVLTCHFALEQLLNLFVTLILDPMNIVFLRSALFGLSLIKIVKVRDSIFCARSSFRYP